MADNDNPQPPAPPAPPSREDTIKKKVSLGLTRSQAEASTPFTTTAPLSEPDIQAAYQNKVRTKIDAGLTPDEARAAAYNEATPEERRPIDILRRMAGGLTKEQAITAADIQIENDKAEAAKKQAADDAALELATRPDPKSKK
jgi:hypothetical protein